MKRISLLIFGLVLSIFVKAETQNYKIDLNQRAQTIEGWGVSLCWWAHMCGSWDEDKIDELVDWMVSPEGLNWNIFRYNIGGGDDPEWRNCPVHHMAYGKGIRAEIPGLQAGPNEPIDLTRDSAQIKLMVKIKERRPDAIFEAFSNSAPYWMTVSGCVGGAKDPNDDNLNPAYYEAFAHYLVDVCVALYKQYGIEFRDLEPFNEPVTNYWNQGGSQEGCHVSPQAQIDFIRVLNPILCASGLHTFISASDETSVGQSIRDFKAYVKADALRLVDQWNTHSYSANNQDRTMLRELAKQHGKTLWMSEVGMGSRGIQGNLQLAQKMFDDLRIMQPTAWVDWQYVEERGNQWSLITTPSFDSQQYHKNHNYYIRQQITRFIPVGYTILKTDNPQCVAAINPSGDELVIVLLNANREEETHQIEIPSGMECQLAYRTSRQENLAVIESPQILDNKLDATLPPLSISTYILKTKKTK